MIAVRILGTAGLLPGSPLSTVELASRLGHDPADLWRKTGIRSRHVVARDASMAAIGADVLRRALHRAGLAAEALERVIFVTSNGGDRIVPATANLLLAHLGLDDRADGFDLNNACVGFLTAFDLAARAVATGSGPIGIVVVELLSRGIRPGDFRPLAIFGDAAAAAVVGPGGAEEGILGSAFANHGGLPEDVVFYHPSATGQMEYVEFRQSSLDMMKTVLQAIRRSAHAACGRAGVPLGEVEWVLPHQPNGRLFKLIVDDLAVDPARTVSVVEETGSVAAAALPYSLDRLLRTRPVRPGDRILLVGVGAGVGRGAILYRLGEPPPEGRS